MKILKFVFIFVLASFLITPLVLAEVCPTSSKGSCFNLNDRACIQDNVYICQSYGTSKCYFKLQTCPISCEFGECVETTCADFCETQIHEGDSNGYWDFSGKYPNCGCTWVIEEPEKAPSCPLKIPVPESWGIDQCLAGWIAIVGGALAIIVIFTGK